MPKLIYIANMRVPTEKAHGLQIFQNCEAFADAGIEVTLWAARRWNTPELRGIQDPFAYYGVKANFKLRRLLSLDLLMLVTRVSWRSALLFYIQEFTFTISALSAAIFSRADVYYSRDTLILLLLSFFKRGLAYEAHSLAQGRVGKLLQKLTVRRVGTVIGITSALRQGLVAMGAKPERAMVAHDGVRRERFENLPSRTEARRELGFPEDAFIVGYIGRLHTMAMDKGVSLLVEALANAWSRPGGFPSSLALVGGPDDMAETLRQQWLALDMDEKRFLYLGHMPPEFVPLCLSACDVCAMPFPWTEHFAYYASPIKLFEYMAARRAIVASDLPAWEDVIKHEEHALLVPPSDVRALADAITRLHHDPLLRQTLAENAYQQVMAHYTWEARAKLILRKIFSKPQKKT
jgi:glycosyltransferase involved in cell wall biosynthesis